MARLLLVAAIAVMGFALVAGPGGTASAAPAKVEVKEKVKAKVKRGVLEVTGSNAAETIELRLEAGDPGRLEVVVDTEVLKSFRLARIDEILVEARAGADVLRIDEANGVFTVGRPTTLDGEDDKDSINGGSGAETLKGGADDDFVDGNRGDDTAFLGAGDDVFRWDPGDGSDRVEGESGADAMAFNGAGVAENIDIAANGERIRFFRDVASITMDLDDVEEIAFEALGGPDTVEAESLAGTDLVELNVDLEGALGSNTGDGQIDTVRLQATGAADTIEITGAPGTASVAGLPYTATISNVEPNDALIVDALGGDDAVSAATLQASTVALSLEGGAGKDTILGSRGRDILLGGSEDDFIDGNQGDDVGFLGAADDVFRWDPGDGSDVVEGQDGLDTLLFNGAGAAENIDISANGQRVRFFRNVASITMDLDDTEKVFFQALGGADNVVVSDLSGTDLTEVVTDLAAAIGGSAGDGAADTVTVDGTNGDDVIVVQGQDGTATVLGLAALVRVEHAEPDRDRLTVLARAGDDVVLAGGLAASAILFAADGGDGDDILVGGPGGESLSGAAGDDVLVGGPGADQLSCGDGDDTAISDAADTVAADCL
jgi:Ca2+-binding RTX toxin-like protein